MSIFSLFGPKLSTIGLLLWLFVTFFRANWV